MTVNTDQQKREAFCAENGHNYLTWLTGHKRVYHTRCTYCRQYKEASADPHLRDLDLSELGISSEQAANFDLIAIKQDAIAREDAAWLEAEQRS